MLKAVATTPDGGVRRTGLGKQTGWKLGVEVGTLSTFYSMENPALGNVALPARVLIQEAEGGLSLDASVCLPDATLRVTEHQLQDGGRSLRVEALEDSFLMDAVLRFRIPLDLVRKVYLGEREIPWRRANKYHQEAGVSALIEQTDGGACLLEPVLRQAPEGMTLFTYLRDEPEGWVLHVRLRAERPDAYSVRGCHRFYNKPFPAWLQAVFARTPALLSRTLYLRERVSQRIPFQTNGAVFLPRGSVLDFGVVCTTR